MKLYYFILNWFEFMDFDKRVVKLLWDFSHIRIKHGKNYRSHCAYDPYRNKVKWVKIGKHKNKLSLYTTLLHELGHIVDFTTNRRSAFSIICPTIEVMRANEIRAWNIAVDLSTKYNIPLNYKWAIKVLSTYGTSLKLLEDLRDKSVGA